MTYIFCQRFFDRFHCFDFKCVWTHIDNLIAICAIFFKHWMCHIYNLKLIYTRNFVFIIDLFFRVTQWKLILVLYVKRVNRIHIWKSHSVDDEASSILFFFISGNILTNFGMKIRTKLITLEWKWMFWSDKTVVLSKGVKS